MRIIKTKGRRGNGDIFYTVDGVASCGTVEQAADLAMESLNDIMRAALPYNLWTQYPVAA